MTPIHFEWREPAHNQLRFYTITVIWTLFGSWAVGLEWGRIGQPGTVRETWFETQTAAIKAGAKVRQRKEKHGYRTLADNGG